MNDIELARRTSLVLERDRNLHISLKKRTECLIGTWTLMLVICTVALLDKDTQVSVLFTFVVFIAPL